MKIYLLNPREIIDPRRLDGHPFRAFNQIFEDATLDKAHRYVLCSEPRDADIIIAPVNDGIYGPFFERLRASRFYHDHHARLLVYSPDDNQHPAVPGLYPSCSVVWWRLGQAMAAHYLSEHFPKFCYSDDELANKDLLCSFVGSVRSHSIRAQIMKLKCPHSLFRDSSATAWWWERPTDEQKPFLDFYRDVAARSRFIICPQGVSAASIRIYEAMEAGAVPVIIADGLVLPEGPQWSTFAIRASTAQVDEIPQLIARHEKRAPEMGALARETWKRFFSPESSFNTLIDWACSLLERRAGMRADVVALLAQISPFLNPRDLRRKVRFRARSALSGSM